MNKNNNNDISSGSTSNSTIEIDSEQRDFLNRYDNSLFAINTTPSNQSEIIDITEESSKTWGEIKDIISI